MKETTFNIGDRVVTIKFGELRKGVIRNFYPVNPPVFAIEFEDGAVEKIPYTDVAPEPKTETPEEKTEPVEKSEITITQDEFLEIASRVIAKNTKGRPIVALVFVPMIAEIHRALFKDPSENDNFSN